MTRRNQVIVIIAALVIIVLGVGGYFLYGQKNNNVNNNLAATQAKPTTNLQSSIADLFIGGETKKCTFNLSEKNNRTTRGTILVTKNMAYANFAINDNKRETKTNLIRNNDTFYIWGDSFPSGIKIIMNVNEMAQKMKSSNYSGFDPDQKVNYNCSPWTLDSAIFTPPSSVKFVDISAMMPKTSPVTTQPKTSVTQAQSLDPCAQITNAAAKAACETAIKK
jgi:hypothetical protein